MNIFQLEYFTTLAETLSYTKASQKLHITQPTLSKLIISLEHLIGSQLFVRNKRDVKLTPAGKVFYYEIKKTLHSYEGALQKVRDMENGTTGVINLGFLGTALVRPLPRIINRFHRQYPTLMVNPLDYSYSQIIDSFEKNLIDMAILPDLEIEKLPKYEKRKIFTDRMCIAVHKDHKFANLDSVELTAIKDEPIINMNPKFSRRDHALINNLCLKEGFMPNTIYEASSLLNMLVMVDCQVGITILADHIKYMANETIRFIPIKGLEDAFNVICIYPKDPGSTIMKLLDVIDDYFSGSKEGIL